MMQRIGVLGDQESVIGYRAVGLKVFACDTREDAVKGLKSLAAECAVIYVVEDTAAAIAEEIAVYEKEKLPAVILIPGNRGSLGIGKSMLNRSVEQAVGSNILDQKE